MSQNLRIPYRPAFAVGTKKSVKGDSANYVGVDFGPTHFVARRADIFNPDGTPKEIMPPEVYRLVGYSPDNKDSVVVPESSEGLVKMVVDAIKQQELNPRA